MGAVSGEFRIYRRPMLRLWAALVVVFVLPACQTRGSKNEGAPAVPPEALAFRPESSLSLIHLDEGRYPNLFSSGSYALWVDEGVARAKLLKDQEAGLALNAGLAEDADFILDNYIVFECRLESLFPDASIAYDVIGLRNIDVYLVTPSGMRVRSIQTILGTHADETPQGALKQFGRTNLLVFAKEDILTGEPTILDDAQGIRLIIDGFNSAFYFEWSKAPLVDAEGEPIVIPPPEPSLAGRLGFSSFYSKLRILAHKFR